MTSTHAQDPHKTAEGFYDLSSFEVAAGVYLLENKTFFYFASFGNVDLKVYGEYGVFNNNVLVFYPDKDLMQDFFIYGGSNPKNKDDIVLHYYRPYDEKTEALVVDDQHTQVKIPEFTSEEDEVSVILKRADTIKIEYQTQGYQTQIKRFMVQVNDSINELKLFHNYYANMVRDLSRISFEIEGGYFIDDNQKKVQKKELDQKTIDQVLAFIEERKNDTSMVREGREYQKLPSHN
ncbi:hypothetical protein [Flagellimonas allohymeniacidonis]|uniref:Uncharacterized protein n=1 Tax=Flagellimonas allohymeniacidonis TaxID=2517819 RepID=A0A4Q8QBC4_9FLAO|nr:hypothetical protein [Allomuricauda hymeniacidonis]TAI47591.1 hypothetical protein EW142_13075 [Allomuricauda hymeniacidonis]